MDIKRFIHSLDEIAIQLRDEDKLLHYSLNPPADENIVNKIKQYFFNGIENELLEFYRYCNGLQMIWSDANLDYAGDFYPLLFYRKDVSFDGVINILPIEDVFSPDLWHNTVWFDNDITDLFYIHDKAIPNNIIKKSLRPVDFFSVSMSMAILVYEDLNYLLLLQDYHIAYEDSFLIKFSTYLDFLIQTKGEVKKRYQTFNILDGYKHPVIDDERLGYLMN